MMLRIVCLLSSLLLINLSLPSVSSSKEQLAVMDLKADYGVEKGLAKALSVKVRNEIHSFGDYEVLSKEDLEALAERTETQLLLGGKCADAICLLDLGRKLGTKYMVYGSISKLGSTYSISLRLLDTKGKNAGVKRRVGEECKCDEDGLLDTVEIVAAKVMGEKPSVKPSKSARGKEIKRDGHFIAYDNGTVLDTNNSLMWAAKDNGKDINWHDAKSYCENYQGGGYTDWRLPTQDELAGLYDNNKRYQTAQKGYKIRLTELIQLSTCLQWASETSGSKALFIFFDFGVRGLDGQSNSFNHRVLPVRRGK